MFTGIIEHLAPITVIEHKKSHVRLAIQSPFSKENIQLGESIALNGVCLTVAGKQADSLFFDLQCETLDKTYLGTLHIGTILNVERALGLGDRMGGHIVQGHVDEVGTIVHNQQKEKDWILEIEASEQFVPYLIAKGSIAIDGISLTIVTVSHNRFTTHIIPYTYDHTTIKFKKTGDKVNLEADILGKYVINYLKTIHK